MHYAELSKLIPMIKRFQIPQYVEEQEFSQNPKKEEV